jgi:hypothetical protein
LSTIVASAGGAASTEAGNSISGAAFSGILRPGRAKLRTSRPVRMSERTITITEAGLLTVAADKKAALAVITEDSIKHFLIFMFYFSAT